MIVQLAQLACLVLVIVGVGVVGTQSAWRETIVGLGVQYLGVAGLLALTAGPSAGVAQAIVATGIILLLANGGFFSVNSQSRLDVPPQPGRRRSGSESRPLRATSNPLILTARQVSSTVMARPFDVSVVALAVVGAIALAATSPLFGSMGVDSAVNTLLISGLLSCLLSGETRVAGGLLFIASAATLALRAADPAPRAIESVLLAVFQMSVALALVYLRTLSSTPAVPVPAAVEQNLQDPLAVADDVPPTQPSEAIVEE
jgi:hypothetical protein